MAPTTEAAGPKTSPRDRGYWNQAFRALARDRLAMAGFIIVVFLCLVALFAPWIAPYDPFDQPTEGLTEFGSPLPPDSQFALGTDRLGRDQLSRLVYGARVSLIVGFGATLIAAVLGLAIGTTAGMGGNLAQITLMRTVDVILAFPTLLLAIALLAVVEPGIAPILIIGGLAFGAGLSRIVFTQVSSLRSRDFVLAAQTTGVKPLAIILRHILPHVLPPVIVYSALSVASTIMFEAALSYIGIGIQSPSPSWGNMISEGQPYLVSAPWLIAVPGITLVVTMIGFALLGDGLRDVLDPTLDRNREMVRGIR